MGNSKIPPRVSAKISAAAPTIPLLPVDGKDFFAVIIPDKDKNNRLYGYSIWIFLQGYDVALFFNGSCEKAEQIMTVDGIRALDAIGEFDSVKDELLDGYYRHG